MPGAAGAPARTAFVLPPKEFFQADAAGAVSNVVQLLARHTPGSVILGARPPGAAFADIGFLPVTRPKPSQLAYLLGICRALAELRPQRIQVHQQARLALLLSRLFPRAAVMLCLHNDPLAMHGMRSAAMRARLLRRLQVVLVSDYLRRSYIQGLDAAAGRPEILYNPIELAELPPLAPAAMRGRVFVFVGRFVPEKGVLEFVAACERVLPSLPGWGACMVGAERYGNETPESPEYREIKGRAARAGIGCTGFLPRAEVLALLARSAIAVVPSRWAEPFGLTALEALACGAALITTRQGGLPEVAGQAAVYVPAGDAAALAACMLALAGDEQRRAQLSESGRARACRFDAGAIAASMQLLWP